VNILHLKYAVEIAKTKSISKAAENLYTTQPNLSRAIKDLEESLGITIFNRTSKGIEITTAGEEFLQYARRAVAQIDAIEEMYRNNGRRTKRFSASVPRATYISDAFTDFSKDIDRNGDFEVFYKETNSMRTIKNIISGEFDVGIIRYNSAFEQYFSNLFFEKKLESTMLAEFSYVLVMSSKSKLLKKKNIEPEDLSDYVEITHGDPYVPSMPFIDVKKAELSEFVTKRICVFDRASQLSLLENVPDTFMWVSPMPQEILDKYDLAVRECASNSKTYKDVLIYRRGYKLTELDEKFVSAVNTAKLRYI